METAMDFNSEHFSSSSQLSEDEFSKPQGHLELGEMNEPYVDLKMCYCDSCGYITRWDRRTTRLLYWGILFPCIWVTNIAILLYGLVWPNKTPISSNEFVSIFNVKVGFVNVLDHDPSFYKLEYLHHHQEKRRWFFAKMMYSLLAILIYSFLVSVVVYGAMNIESIRL